MSNKISINADKTNYMQFSFNKNVNFPDRYLWSGGGNNTINETSVTKFLGIGMSDKKLNFVNHITEMSMKVAKSIGLLYKLNCFLSETS